MTNKIVSQVAKLQFYFVVYSRKNKYKSRYFIKKRSSEYKE